MSDSRKTKLISALLEPNPIEVWESCKSQGVNLAREGNECMLIQRVLESMATDQSLHHMLKSLPAAESLAQPHLAKLMRDQQVEKYQTDCDQKFKWIEYLLLNKVDVNATTSSYNYSALHYLAGRTHLSYYPGFTARLWQLFKRFGADLNASTSDGVTPLHAAAQEGNYPAMLSLVPYVNIDAVNSNLSTPLHLAVRSANVEAVRILLRCNANLHAKDAQGITPLEINNYLRHKDNAIIMLSDGTRKPISVVHYEIYFMLEQALEAREKARVAHQRQYQALVRRGEAVLVENIDPKFKSKL